MIVYEHTQRDIDELTSMERAVYATDDRGEILVSRERPTEVRPARKVHPASR